MAELPPYPFRGDLPAALGTTEYQAFRQCAASASPLTPAPNAGEARIRSTPLNADLPPSPIVHVLIDDRERDSEAARSLMAVADTSCEFRRLEVGDYLVDGRLLVERKTLPDLVASVEDGRLFRQTARLVASGMRAALLLEGSCADLAGRGMRREAIQGALITVSIVWGLPVLRAMDGAESARLMLCAARQLRRHMQGAAYRPGLRMRGKRRLQSHILQGLPGVGRRLADRLIARFGSVVAAVSAPEEELLEVQGLGKKKAARIRWAVSENRATFSERP